MKIVDCLQGSSQWHEARLGRVTASGVADVLARLKTGANRGGDTATRAAYKSRIVAEILAGVVGDTFVSGYMQWGTEQEPYARAAYEVRNDVSVDTVGFVIHPAIDRAGSSPDGLVGEYGMVELKNPKTSTHIEYMLAGVLPAEYEPQVMFNLACTDREWCDFVSFDSRLPLRHQLFTVRVDRNEDRIKEIEDGVRSFLAEVDEIIAKLCELNPEVDITGSIPFIESELGITDEDIRNVDRAWNGDAITAQIAAADGRMQELVGGMDA